MVKLFIAFVEKLRFYYFVKMCFFYRWLVGKVIVIFIGGVVELVLEIINILLVFGNRIYFFFFRRVGEGF